MFSVAIYPYREDPFIRSLRVQAWFRAVTVASGLTAGELERLFVRNNNTQSARSCIWNKYRRGEVVPRSGTLNNSQSNLVERVEATFPGTAKWLTLPLWRLADRAPMEMSEIRRCYESLPAPIRAMFIDRTATSTNIFWRRPSSDCKRDCDTLLRFSDPDGLTAVLTMYREAESIQDSTRHGLCRLTAMEYIDRLRAHPVIGTVGNRLKNYLQRESKDRTRRSA